MDPLSLFALLLGSSHIDQDYTNFQWFIGLCLCSLYIAYKTCSVVGKLPGIFLGYILLNAVYTFACRWNYYGLNAHHLIYPATLHSLGSLVSIAFVSLSVVMLNGSQSRRLIETLPAFTTLNSCLVLWAAINNKILSGNTGYSGLLDYASANGCLIAICLPMLLAEKKWWQSGIAAAAIIASGSSMPYGVAAVGVGSLALKRRMFSGIFWIICVFAIGFAFEKHDFFNSAGRLGAYKTFMTAWWEKGYIWNGMGLGSFAFLGPTIQCEKLFEVSYATGQCVGNFWGWLHSDWLELLFDTGIVGLSLGLLLVIAITVKLYVYKGPNHEGLFSMWLSINAMAIFNYPKEFFVLSFLYVLLLVLACRLDSSKEALHLDQQGKVSLFPG